MIPRIKGRVGQIDDGDDKGKWAFEISIWTFDGESQVGEPFVIGPWPSEDVAAMHMKRAIRLVAEKCECMNGGEPSGKFFDLKNGGVMRPWDEN